MSNTESTTVRDSMLELMEDAGVIYEVDEQNGAYDDDERSDAGSVPSSSNLSDYFPNDETSGR
eukprot:13934722-Ditylum_brightwellii.AAC.1